MITDFLRSIGEDIHPINSKFGWYYYEAKTPSNKFIYLIWEVAEMPNQAQIVLRDQKIDENVHVFMEEVESFTEWNSNLLQKNFGLKLPSNKMNTWIAAPSSYYLFADDDPVELEAFRNAFLCFPAFDMEFSGEESPPEFRLMRKEFVPTLDWYRSPCPKVKMRYDEVTSGMKTIGKKRYLTNIGAVISQIAKLEAIGSFMELENYKKEILCATRNAKSTIMLEILGIGWEEIPFESLEHLRKKIMDFLTHQ
jgi:hypothetical protein